MRACVCTFDGCSAFKTCLETDSGHAGVAAGARRSMLVHGAAAMTPKKVPQVTVRTGTATTRLLHKPSRAAHDVAQAICKPHTSDWRGGYVKPARVSGKASGDHRRVRHA